MATDDSLPQLVVVGSSSGGIEALLVLASSLPADFAAPIVIAQHLEPRRRSQLGQILGRRSTLPVQTVQDETRLDAGTIYVVPSDRDVEVQDGHVRVLADGERAPEAGDGGPGHVVRPSIDRLLRSAANAYGEGLIAVILTGMGADGAAGARDVKQAGGTVIIQDPSTARFPAMPQSLAPTTVDIVAELEAIGPLLHELLTGPQRVMLPAEDRRLRTLLAQVREQTGIDFGAYKTPTILRRLQRRMVATDARDLSDYLRYLQRHPEEYQRLASSFLIKVTGFFRDPELYKYLREQVMPELIAEARGRGNELRLWSAGCATGEEAYSLAMLVADALGDELERFAVRVFATDLDDDAVSFARRGVYPAQALHDVPPQFAERYFTEHDGEYTVRKSVRGLTVFGQHDLGQRAPFPRIDLALCRNVLIYFTPDLQKRALQLFAFALRQGGYLALGKAETTTPLAEFFTLAESRLKIYRRQGGHPVTIPAARIRDALPVPIGRAPAPALSLGARGGAGSTPTTPDAASGGYGRGPQRLGPAPPRGLRVVGPLRPIPERSQNLLQHLPIGVVVVDRRYDIQTINNAARRLLGIHSAAIGEDVVHLVRTVPSAALRTALDAALRSEPSDTGDTADAGLQVVADVEIEGRVIQVDCFPYRLVSDADPQALILVNDISNSMHARRELERQLTRAREELAAAQSQHAGELEQLRQQVQHLTSVNRDLLEANQELIEANTALHDQNEELLVGHEEAEAATEEVETLNEELQATNEEQETLNEELQATVEELNTTNDDLEARSAELQELAASLDAERERLHVILSSMSDAVLVLDQHGAPVLANDTYRRAFGEAADGVAALPVMGDAQGRLLPPDQKLPDQAVRGVPFTLQFTTAGPGGALRWFEAKGQPVRAESLERSTVITIRETGPQWGAQITTASVDGGVDGDDRSRERTARRSRMQPDEDDGGSTAS